MTASRLRLVSAARAGWGTALLLAPAQVLRAGGPGFATPPAIAVARVLGVRHVAQAAVTALAPTGAVGVLGAMIDGVHALSDLVAAAVSARWRRAATIDAVITAALGAASWTPDTLDKELA